MENIELKNTKENVDNLLRSNKYRFAKTMSNIPHYYTLRETWEVDSDFVDVVLFMRKFGQTEKWGNRTFTYYYLDGHKYWTMGNPVCYKDRKKTFVINRAVANSTPKNWDDRFKVKKKPVGLNDFFETL